MLKPRQRKLISNLETNGYNIGKAAIDAGYAASTADKKPGQILKSALKAKVKDTLATLEGNSNRNNKQGVTTVEAKVLMSELVGLSREEMMNTLKKIALQDKDYSSALKVLAPLVKEIGVLLQDDEAKTIVPILNIGIRENSSPEPSQSLIEGVVVPVTPTVKDVREDGETY